MLTFQGHAEFDRFVNGETLKFFAKAAGWKEKFLVETLEEVERDDDAHWAAGMMLRFFLENENDVDEGLEMGGEEAMLEEGVRLWLDYKVCIDFLFGQWKLWSDAWYSRGYKAKRRS